MLSPSTGDEPVLTGNWLLWPLGELGACASCAAPWLRRRDSLCSDPIATATGCTVIRMKGLIATCSRHATRMGWSTASEPGAARGRQSRSDRRVRLARRGREPRGGRARGTDRRPDRRPRDWYPPVYDCGACGYATCAVF